MKDKSPKKTKSKFSREQAIENMKQMRAASERVRQFIGKARQVIQHDTDHEDTCGSSDEDVKIVPSNDYDEDLDHEHLKFLRERKQKIQENTNKFTRADMAEVCKFLSVICQQKDRPVDLCSLMRNFTFKEFADKLMVDKDTQTMNADEFVRSKVANMLRRTMRTFFEQPKLKLKLSAKEVLTILIAIYEDTTAQGHLLNLSAFDLLSHTYKFLTKRDKNFQPSQELRIQLERQQIKLKKCHR